MLPYRTAGAQGFDQFQIAHGDFVEHQVILRLEIDDVANVCGVSSLRLLRITQTRARSTNRFVFARETVTIQRPYFEVS